jgi:hypothetical protein
LVERIEAFRCKDGRVCTDERTAILHEAALTLRESQNPRLRSSISAILESADEVLAALIPLVPSEAMGPMHDSEAIPLFHIGIEQPVGYIDEKGGYRSAGIAA